MTSTAWKLEYLIIIKTLSMAGDSPMLLPLRPTIVTYPKKDKHRRGHILIMSHVYGGLNQLCHGVTEGPKHRDIIFIKI